MSDGTTYYYCQICNLGVLHTRHPDCQVCAYVAAARADERAKVIEECAKAVESLFGGSRAKWGSENSDMYHIQDETRAMAARAIRALATTASEPELKQGG